MIGRDDCWFLVGMLVDRLVGWLVGRYVKASQEEEWHDKRLRKHVRVSKQASERKLAFCQELKLSG